MKWLIIQSAGEHNGFRDSWTPNHYLRECWAIQHAIEQIGDTCTVWGFRHNNFLNPPNFEKFDVILNIENYEFSWIPDLSNVKPLKLYWCIDLHYQGPNPYLNIVSQNDVILHSTKKLIPVLQKEAPFKKHIWFPNAVDDRYFNANIFKREKLYDIIFIGKTRPLVEKLVEEVGMQYFFATGMDMIKKIAETKIHFNNNIGLDINYRTFETIGLGTCLLTNFNSELFDLDFVVGKNCLTYNYYEEAVAAFEKCIKDSTWKQIGDEGFKLSKQHTYTQRIKNLKKEVCL